MALNTERRKLLEAVLPESIAVTRKWLKTEMNLETHAIDNLVKSTYLKSIQRGVYVRGSVKLSWQSIVYTLQHVMQTDLIIGGLTALELKGFSHYLPISEKKQIYLYGNDVIPDWVDNTSEKAQFTRYRQNELFSDLDTKVEDKITRFLPWHEELSDLKIASPELAILHVLLHVPENISFEHADQLIQGMTSLSPRKLQMALEACVHIKVKRLFLWFGALYQYTWFQKLDTNTIDLGKGNRVIVKGGTLDKTYKITVPKDYKS